MAYILVKRHKSKRPIVRENFKITGYNTPSYFLRCTMFVRPFKDNSFCCFNEIMSINYIKCKYNLLKVARRNIDAIYAYFKTILSFKLILIEQKHIVDT